MVHFVRALGALTAVGWGVAVLTAAAQARPDQSAPALPGVVPLARELAVIEAQNPLGAAAAGLFLPIEIEVIATGPQEVEQLTVLPREEGSSACPYLRQKAQPRPTTVIDPEAAHLDSPLDNLRKLVQAERLCEQGERCLAAGQRAAACDCYERAAKVCPGSRYSVIAGMRAAQVRATLAAEAGQAECEEPVRHDCCKPGARCAADAPGLPVCFDLSARTGCCRVNVSVSLGTVRSVSLGLGISTEAGPPIGTVKVRPAGCCGDCGTGDCLQHWLEVLGGCGSAALAEEKRAKQEK
jgi:hypothetical protein